jgi:hypothetical protein
MGLGGVLDRCGTGVLARNKCSGYGRLTPGNHRVPGIWPEARTVAGSPSASISYRSQMTFQNRPVSSTDHCHSAL